MTPRRPPSGRSRAEGISGGAAVSLLARRGLGADARPCQGEQIRIEVSYSPFPVLLGDAGHDVTPELVNAHRDDDESGARIVVAV